ncbi:MAG: guanylate kinase [Planctomycetota bacterium]
MSARRGTILVVSGPSGVGKSSVCTRLLHGGEIILSVSATTRAPRGHEQDGVDYQFLTPDEFQRRVDAGYFLEWARVHGQTCYGTPRAPVEDALAKGRHVLLDIDVQGAQLLREQGLPVASVFLKAPGPDELRRRLEGRGDTDAAEIERRLERAEQELREAWRYDLVVTNRKLDRTLATIRAYLDLPLV